MSDVDRLREIYMDVSEGSETTTEQQHEERGRWQSNANADADARIRETITEMHDRYGLDTQLSTDQLVTLVKAYFEGDGDTAIAHRLGDPSLDKTVTRARLGLHLFRESDTTADFDTGALRECFEAGNSGAECARRLDIGNSTANRYRRSFAAKADAEQVDNEFYKRFQRYCRGEGDVVDYDTDYIGQDGLDDAVADAGADNPQLQ
jgi:hypothetical protein